MSVPMVISHSSSRLAQCVWEMVLAKVVGQVSMMSFCGM